jgi:hypothetical protein
VNPVETYVRDLDRALHGPRRAKRDLLREVHDHLVDATDALVEEGASPSDAQARAVGEFGPVDVVAPEYQTVLASGHVRRTSLLLLLVTLLQPLAWGPLTGDAAAAAEPGSVLYVLDGVVETLGRVTVLAAVALALLEGVGVRFFGIRRGLIRMSCRTNLALSGAIVVMAAAMSATSTGAVWATVAQAVAVTILPFGVVAGDSVRCLRAVS